MSNISVLQQLRRLRKSRKLTQQQAADRGGLNRTTYSRAESGEQDAQLSTLLAMCDALDADLLVVPRSLAQPVQFFIESGGKVLGHAPGISAPRSRVDG